MSDMAWNPEIADQEVRVKGNPSYRGMTTGKTRVSGTRLLVQVQFAPNERSYKPYNLLELCQEETLSDLFRQGKFSGADDLRRILTFEKLTGQLTNIFYSMESSQTDFYPHQFKPVLKFLESPVGRLLVADEVGLGKTIEAMYVWKELQARSDARRLLILCPAILREKWQDDLQQRFNIFAKLTSAQELLEESQRVLKSQYQHSFVCIASLEGIRPSADWEDETNSGARAELARLFDQNPVTDELGLFDLVVIDEAHYLRNQSTATHRLGQLVRDASRHLLLLTATPIQTESSNLYQLLKIISPEDFFDETIFHQMQKANAPLIGALRSLWSHPPDLKTAKRNLDLALQSEYFRENSVLQYIKTTLETPETIDAETQVRLGYKLENASLISQYLTRSRKRDVIPHRVKRVPQTLQVCLSPREKQIYDSVTQVIRKQSRGKQGIPLFRLIAYQRQMASCLVAALQSWSEQGTLSEMQEDELFWEDLGIVTEMQPQSQERLDRIEQLTDIDYHQLEAEDTKYRNLVEFLRDELKKNPTEQFVLFAYLRGTLHYLQRRLEADGIQTHLILGGMGDRKWEVLQQFKEGKASILLSSEVGSEGIDLQFCRFLINYDLPWNPMRVEQRIGRLDCLGQKADRISIVNFSLADTIEERILNRLYDRIQVFQESIGDLENILGEATEQLLVTLFDPELTDEERLQRAEQTASAILKQHVEQERLEQEAINLIAFSDHILNAVTKSRDQGRWITSAELYSFVEDYFARYYEGTTIKPRAMFICGVWGKEKKGRILLDNKKKDQTGIHHE
jgi:SNF2 family DNA or RNA helicase